MTQAPPLCTINGSITPAVESVVLRALEKRREDRPQTAGELAGELTVAVYGPAGPRRAAVPTSPLDPQPTAPQNSGRAPGARPPMHVSQPISGGRPAASAGRPPFPSGANRTTKVKRSYMPLVLGAASLAVFGAVVPGVVLLWPNHAQNEGNAGANASSTPSPAANASDARPAPTRQVNAAALRGTPQPTPSPVVTASTADDDVNALREQINDLRKQGRLSNPDLQEVRQVAASVDDADKKNHQTDFRFLYEGAKLYVNTSEHHESFELLFRAAREAISAGKSGEMLNMLVKDGGGDFYRLTTGHPEWVTLRRALESGDASILISEPHHHHH